MGELDDLIRERQKLTLEHYRRDPDLLEEHVGMEDNFEAGGYGERQVQELLQNGVDQLIERGRIEFRLAGGVLYCANEGNPFTTEGIKAVTGAFLSSKRDDKIGRFGLGFKAVLGVTDNPQIISRTVAFGFNEPEAAALLESLPYKPRRVPTLRVPSLIDAPALAARDGHLAELMEWATTVIRLPLVRAGGRIRVELARFDPACMLFMPNLGRLDISLEEPDGSLQRHTFRREQVDENLVSIVEEEGSSKVWRVLERRHRVSPDVMASLPEHLRREEVTVSYALEQRTSATSTGRFWAWFPLQDETTASGIFNAPWQVTDDRTAMLPGSRLNHELLNVAAELLLEAATAESLPSDPARHFDILPARGRETRSDADRYMSSRLPQLARRLALIPTAAGGRASGRDMRVPVAPGQQNPFALPHRLVEMWASRLASESMPHPSCYSNVTRAARLRQLLTSDDDEPACATLTLSEWVDELRRVDPRAAIRLVSVAVRESQLSEQFADVRAIPLADGDWLPASEARSVVFPSQVEITSSSVRLADPDVAADPEMRECLAALGVQQPSPDVVANAAAAGSSSRWSDGEWQEFWALLAMTTPEGGAEAIEELRKKGVTVKLPTQGGAWRKATEVCVDPDLAPGLPDRLIDNGKIRNRLDLARLAGAFDGVVDGISLREQGVWAEYVADAEERALDDYRAETGSSIGGKLEFPVVRGAGPLDLLAELHHSTHPLAKPAIAKWSRDLALRVDSRPFVATFRDARGKTSPIQVPRPEVWATQKYGLVETSQGLVPTSGALSRDLERYRPHLPVAHDPAWDELGLPDSLEKAPLHALKEFMTRDGYFVDDLEIFHEILAACARRQDLDTPSLVPAIRPNSQEVRLADVATVVVATAEDLRDLAHTNLAYVPSGPGDDAITSRWGVARAAEALASNTDWVPSEEARELTDLYPTLADRVLVDIWKYRVTPCREIIRRIAGPTGVFRTSLQVHVDGYDIYVDHTLDRHEILEAVSKKLGLGLGERDISGVLEDDDRLRQSQRIQRVKSAPELPLKLLALVGRDELARALPEGLLALVEHRQGALSEDEVASLFLDTYGNDALRELRSTIERHGLRPPKAWDGTAEAVNFVATLGFPRAFAGTRDKQSPQSELVPGRVELRELHPFQVDLAHQIKHLATVRKSDGNAQRGLLYLPTGAGKTRVTTQALAELLRDGELGSPVLWIAQSSELCEQAIVSWSEVWRSVGDQRPLEICRFWANYDVEESAQELQVVVAIDDKLTSAIGDDKRRSAYGWLRNASIVVIDEAHRAGARTYTELLRWLGITRRGANTTTERPLLGLTATPFRGTNKEANEHFAARFDNNLLQSLPSDDPIGALREMRVLAKVQHEVLDGVLIQENPVPASPDGSSTWTDVSRDVLEKLGSNLERTQMLVDHIMSQDPDWPILVYTPSVASAHVTAALLRSLGREAAAVDGRMRPQERRRKIEDFRAKRIKVLVNCDLLTQGFDAPEVRAVYIARPTFSPNLYLQMVGRGLRGPENGGTEECLLVNVVDTFAAFDRELAYKDFQYLWGEGD